MEQLQHILGNVDLDEAVGIVQDEEVSPVPGNLVAGLERPAGRLGVSILGHSKGDGAACLRGRFVVLAHSGLGLPSDADVLVVGRPTNYLEAEVLPAVARHGDKPEKVLVRVGDDARGALSRRVPVNIELDVRVKDLVGERHVAAPERQVGISDLGLLFSGGHFASVRQTVHRAELGFFGDGRRVSQVRVRILSQSQKRPKDSCFIRATELLR